MTSSNIAVIPMPGIDGVTLEHNGYHFLRPELLLDFISVTDQRITSVTPLAVLYAVTGVRQMLTLRGIPVAVNGRIVYPVSSLSLPSLRAHLIINEQTQKLRFQGKFISLPDTEHNSDTVLLGLSLTFSGSNIGV